jgi:Tol biopolymer transport system component
MTRRWLPWTLACCVGVVAAGSVLAASAAATPRGPAGQIVFRRYFDPDHRTGALFTMNPNGTRVRRLTHPAAGWLDTEPDWSADGRRVVFVRGLNDERTRITIVDADGGHLHFATRCRAKCLNDYDPAWAPSGRWIAFTRVLLPILPPDPGFAINVGVWLVRPNGTGLHQVTNPTRPGQVEDYGAQFSPDGRMLVFERVRNADFRSAVFVQRVGRPASAHRLTPWQMNCGDHPDWSPDQSLLLFRCRPDDGSSNIYWVHPDGAGLHQLTHAAAGTREYLSSSFAPSFRRGSGWITTARDPGYGPEGNADVFRLRISAGTVGRWWNLTKSTIWDSATDWGTHPPVR